MDKIVEILLDALPIVARVTAGYATLTNKNGERIKTIDSSGKEIEGLNGVCFDLARETAEKNMLYMVCLRLRQGLKPGAFLLEIM